MDGPLGVAGLHLAPVQHLVALGDHGQQALRRMQVGGLEQTQLVHVLGAEEEALRRVLPAAVLADMAGQIARRVHGGVEQDGAAVGPGRGLAQRGGVKAAQRAAHQDPALALRPVPRQGRHQGHRLGGRGRQLGAEEMQIRALLAHPAGHALGLGRAGRGAKTVQIEQMAGASGRGLGGRVLGVISVHGAQCRHASWREAGPDAMERRKRWANNVFMH